MLCGYVHPDRAGTMPGAPQLAVRAEGTAGFFAAGSVCCPGAAAVECCVIWQQNSTTRIDSKQSRWKSNDKT